MDVARETLCRLLAACYYQPGPEFAEEKVFETMCAAASRIDGGLAGCARRLGEAFAAEGHEDLLLDYTRLFLGPGEAIAQPYGSFWLSADGILMGDTTAAVSRLYEEGGFEIAEDFRELPDHIAAELEFLYLLIFRENQVRRAGDPQSLAAVADLRRRFLADHLGRWVGQFTGAVTKGAKSGFYRELAALTGRFVRIELDRAFNRHLPPAS